MPEGDTIHRVARRINLALAGHEIERAEAPNPRSPLHRRAGELRGRTLERAEVSIESGRRPHWVYRGERRRCPRCGERIAIRMQGDANRATYWCRRCQA